MDDPKFTPQAIEFSSKACTAICMWARAMYKYHFVALGVAPKRSRLRQAEEELAVVMRQLAVTKKTLQDVNDRLAQLQRSYDEAIDKKNMLEQKEQTCKIQLSNADKLVSKKISCLILIIVLYVRTLCIRSEVLVVRRRVGKKQWALWWPRPHAC